MTTTRSSSMRRGALRFGPWSATIAAIALGLLVGIGCTASSQGEENPLPVYGYRVVARFPHAPDCYTQGLAFHDGYLYEGTGQYGASALYQKELASGEVVRERRLAPRLFGEGITIFEDRIYQLTWKSGVVLVWDLASFRPVKSFRTGQEAWGITHDGEQLITSDGSSRLVFRDPATFRALRAVTVRAGKWPRSMLNELEYIDGEVWANVWKTDRIARIDPQSGAITAWVDLAGLRPRAQMTDPEAVLNGIAYDAATERIFVTGKRWPVLYEIELVSPDAR